MGQGRLLQIDLGGSAAGGCRSPGPEERGPHAQPALISTGRGLINPRRGLPGRVRIMETGRAPGGASGAVGGAGPGASPSRARAEAGRGGPGRGSAIPRPSCSRPGAQRGPGGPGRVCRASGEGRSVLGPGRAPLPLLSGTLETGPRLDARIPLPAASRRWDHGAQSPGAAPAFGPDPGAVLLWLGRGPRRPRAEEAGKEARRRERGMIHPREPESETPQSGNSLSWAGERSRRRVRPARTCVPHWQSPASSPGPSPAVGGRGRPLLEEWRRILDKVRRCLLCSDWLVLARAVFPRV